MKGYFRRDTGDELHDGYPIFDVEIESGETLLSTVVIGKISGDGYPACTLLGGAIIERIREMTGMEGMIEHVAEVDADHMDWLFEEKIPEIFGIAREMPTRKHHLVILAHTLPVAQQVILRFAPTYRLLDAHSPVAGTA